MELQAAVAIHTNFERGSIKVEVLLMRTFFESVRGGKSMAPIKVAAKYTLEGGKYGVQDLDIIHFQFIEL